MTLLRAAELDGNHRADVRLVGDTVTEIAPALTRLPGETMLDARGGALLPGLCDHHLHLHALAAYDRSVQCGPPAVTTPDALAEALSSARSDEHGWLRGVGYHESVAGLLDANTLDALHSRRPVRIQHRSGALWLVNSAGATELGLAAGNHPGIERNEHGYPTGRLWRADDWLRHHLPRAQPPALTETGTRLARLGITAVTDATPDLDQSTIDALTGAIPQRVLLLGIPLGRSQSTGPYKIVLADSGLPEFDTLKNQIRAAHEEDRPVAVHCVTREALVYLLAALDEIDTRSGDRIEHAALVPIELLPRIAKRGLRVVTQPGFLTHRGDDYLRDVPAEDHPDLYRLGSLTRAGIQCTPSSDAPYGPLDPWAVIDAAAHRTTPAGRTVGADERIGVREALAGYLSSPNDPGGPARRVQVGATADLVLLHTPLAEVLQHPSADLVRATIIGGTLVTGD